MANTALDKVLTSPSDDAHPTSAPASKSPNPSASANPSAKRYLPRIFRYLKIVLPDPSLQVRFGSYMPYVQLPNQAFFTTFWGLRYRHATVYTY